MILLWTDALIFFLVFMLSVLGFYMRGKEEIQRPWKKVAANKVGMVSMVLLLFFVTYVPATILFGRWDLIKGTFKAEVNVSRTVNPITKEYLENFDKIIENQATIQENQTKIFEILGIK